MSRLKGTRAYLIGSIDRTADSGHGWRNALIPYLEGLGVTVFNPLNKPIDIGLEHDDARAARDKYKKAHNWDALTEVMKKVRCVDLRMVDVCDFLVCCLDLSEHPCGTYEELFWANREKKPILICCKQGKAQMPDWLFAALPHQHMFDNWDDLKTYLNHVAFDAEYEHYNRWFLFNNLIRLPEIVAESTKFNDMISIYNEEVNTDLKREVIHELGRKGVYHTLPPDSIYEE